MAITHIPEEFRTSKRGAAFWRRVDVRGSNDCWLWNVVSQLTPGGYGAGHYGSEIHTTSHRIAYMLVKGRIPDGLDVLHTCDVRRCCNTAHHFLGTKQDNSDDMVQKGRWSRETSFAGDGNPNARISSDQLPQFFEDAKSMSQRKVAVKYGISKSQVGNILRGESRPNAVKALADDQRDAVLNANARRAKR
jgi:hypothetical protein